MSGLRFVFAALLFVSLSSAVFAQSIVLSYSTYLPPKNRAHTDVVEIATSSVDSTGAACVTDGTNLWVYDAAGTPTVLATSLQTSVGLSATAVFRDQHGNCFVAGTGVSPQPGDTVFNKPVYAVAKFGPTGTKAFATFFGGTPVCCTFAVGGVAVDPSGNVYIAGTTDSADFPTHSALQNLLQGPQSGFILKLNPSGTSLIYSTFFGNTTSISGIATDAGGDAFITGRIGATGNGGGSIPTTAGAFQTTAKSAKSPFVAKLNSAGTLGYGTYLGGTVGDFENAIAVDGNGSAYVAGQAISPDFPSTPGAFQTTAGPDVVTKLSADGTALVYSTFLGSPASGTALNHIALDSSGNAYVAGDTNGSAFPLVNPIQSDLPDETVTAINSTGTALLFSTYFGGDGSSGGPPVLTTRVASLGVDASGNVYISGDTSLNGFPIVAANNGVLDEFLECFGLGPTNLCLSRGFLAKISPGSGTVLASPSGVNFGPERLSVSEQSSVLIANVGTTSIQINNVSVTGDYSISSDSCLGALSSAHHCEIVVSFTPTAAGTRTGVLTITSNAPDSPRNIQLTGTAAVPVVSLSPSGLALTSPSIGVSGPPQSVTLTNTGADTLNISGLVIVGASAADFSETHTCSGQVAVNASCQINVTYKASTLSTESAAVQITDNAAGSPHMVNLTGTISISGPVVSLSVSSLALTSPSVGASGPTQSVTLTNTGAATLNINGLAIVGASAADFGETNTCTAQLAPNANCQINVTYKASTSSTESAAVQITDNAAGSPHMVNLTGTVSVLGLGLGPGMPSSVTIAAGQTATYNLVVGGPGFSGSASLSCSGAPAGANCNVPNSVNLSGTPTPFQVTVSTTARSLAAAIPNTRGVHPPTLWTMVVAALGFGLLGAVMMGDNRRRKLGSMALVCLFMLGITSCGGGGNGGTKTVGTPAGTYTIVVTASNGAGTSQSMNLTLNVN